MTYKAKLIEALPEEVILGDTIVWNPRKNGMGIRSEPA